VERTRALPDGDAERVGLAAMSYALGAAALELALLPATVRALRRGWRTRGGGARPMAHAAGTRPLLALVCSYAVYRVLGRFVLLRRTVRRGERDAAARPT